jgi:ascorbate-specific PTS system EIIC-type component UlaA
VEIRKASYLKGWHSAYSDRTGVQTWLEDGTFIAQYGQGAQLGLWAYPQGGAATKVLGPFLSGNVNIYGIVVSRASKR